MVRADRKDGTVSFPENWDCEGRIHENEAQLVLKHGLVGLPARIDRRIRFLPKGVEHTVTLMAEEAIQVSALYELIPLHRNKKGFDLLFRRNGKWQSQPGEADAFWCGDNKGNGILFIIDRPLEISVSGESEFRSGQRVLPVRLHLPPSLDAGATVSFQLTMQGYSKENLSTFCAAEAVEPGGIHLPEGMHTR